MFGQSEPKQTDLHNDCFMLSNYYKLSKNEVDNKQGFWYNLIRLCFILSGIIVMIVKILLCFSLNSITINYLYSLISLSKFINAVNLSIALLFERVTHTSRPKIINDNNN